MAEDTSAGIIAAADASFLIGLCFAGQAALLDKMAARIYLAPGVWHEVVVGGQGRPGVEAIVQSRCIVQQPVQNSQSVAMLRLFLGAGEAETLTLAQETGCALVLMDDLKARKAAQQAGIRVLGVVGFLLSAKQRGNIAELKIPLEMLTARGFRLSKTLIEQALQAAGEG